MGKGRSPSFLRVYLTLKSHFGFLDWWPGETNDEILIGAILTQQTSWKNVERAMANLRSNHAISVKRISSMNIRRLEGLIRSSGYYRQKARRLNDICRYIIDRYGSLQELLSIGTDELRSVLLSLKGIGDETADSIALYAADRPIFVIDAYTKREMSRIYKDIPEGIDYRNLQMKISGEMPHDTVLYQDMHAQLVELGKHYCKKTDPRCSDCPLHRMCRYGASKTPGRA